MLINDESCNSEKTILKYQENGIVDLLGSDWYGILLLSPGGRVYLDTYNDIHGIGNEIPVQFVQNCVEYDSLVRHKTQTYEYKNVYFFVYSIRQTDKGNRVLFLHCRLEGPFDERDIKWYELYSNAGQQRVLLENELIQEKNYLSSIMESTEGCIAVVDPEYRVISCNDSAKALFGDNLKISPTGEILILMKAVDRVMAQKEKIVLPRIIFKRAENEFGFSIYKFVLTPLRSSKGKVACVVIVATDITQKFIDRRRVTQKQHFQAVGSMTFEMSKDMRTPLMNIQGCASLLESFIGESEEAQELLSFIQDEVNHICHINGHMLSFCNIADDNSYVQISVNEILQNCISALYLEKTRRKLTVETDLEGKMPMVRMKNIDMQQLFYNLLLSSLSSIREKGTLRVVSRYERQQDSVVVEIMGDGINQDFEERQLYLQINGGKTQGWIDIPFLLAKQIILDCGGKLETKPGDNGSSIQSVTLPCSV